MIHRPDALKHLAPHWFAIVMSLCGLALAWGRAVPMLGDIAGAGALLLAGAAALVFVALALLSLLRWQHLGDAVAADLAHPVRHAFFATMPVSLILLATCGVELLGASGWLAALWWLGSLGQFGVTLWVLARWLYPDPARRPGWHALTPVLFVPVVGNVLAPLAGDALGAGGWVRRSSAWGCCCGRCCWRCCSRASRRKGRGRTACCRPPSSPSRRRP